jgi:hypothetical protein
MQRGHILHFNCQQCNESINFSIFNLEQQSNGVACSQCAQSYSFDDENLKRQLIKFEKLCRQIIESQEILGDMNVGIDVEGKKVKVPYKILLARLGATLDLNIGATPLSIEFRMDPLEDIPNSLVNKTHRPDQEEDQRVEKISLNS